MSRDSARRSNSFKRYICLYLQVLLVYSANYANYGQASIRGTRRVKRAGVQSSEVKALLEKSVEIERLCGIPTSRFVQPFDASHNRNLCSLDSTFVHQRYSWHIFHQMSTVYLSSDVRMAILPQFLRPYILFCTTEPCFQRKLHLLVRS